MSQVLRNLIIQFLAKASSSGTKERGRRRKTNCAPKWSPFKNISRSYGICCCHSLNTVTVGVAPKNSHYNKVYGQSQLKKLLQMI